MPISDFRNRTAVVTGAGSGIGLAIGTALSSKGCHVALLDLREERLRTAAESLSLIGVRVSTHPCDVSDPESVATVRESVLADH
mgnify:FL=1